MSDKSVNVATDEPLNPLLRLVLFILVFLTTFNLTTTLSAGTYIASDLGGSHLLSPYSVSFFTLGNVCTFPLGHHFASRYGKRNIVFISLIFFIIMNYLCSFSPTYFIFILFRFLNGCAGGILSQASGALITHHTPPKNKLVALAYSALIMTLTTTLGQVYGAFIAYEYSWPWIFHLQTPVFLLCLVVIYKYKPHFERSNFDPFDWIGFSSFAITVSCLVTIISLGQQLDWFRSPLISTLIGAFGVFGLFFIFWERKTEKHFMRLLLCKRILFAMSLICIFTLNSGYYGIITSLSLWLHIEVNYTPTYICVILLTMVISSFTLFFVFRYWEKKIISFENIMASIFIFGFAAFYCTRFNSEINFARLMIAHTITGFGYSFATFPLLLYTIRSLPTNDAEHGTALFQTIRLLAVSIGSVFYVTMWIKRTVFYNERLGSILTDYSELTKQTIDQTILLGASKEQAKHLLNEALHRQASALALADCFYFIGWAMVILFIMGLIYMYLERKSRKKLEDFGGI
jgi:MFS transporter, DHA2 family, multidrug resistance protein